MANVINPSGATPLRMLSGAGYSGQTNLYSIPSTDGSIFSIGDFVKSVASGDVTGIPNVQKAAAGDTVRGVISGIFVVPPTGATSSQGVTLDLSVINIPATKTKAYYVAVVDDPMVIFEMADDGAAALTNTACNKNANFVVTNPTAPIGISASTINSSTVNTTQAFSLKLLGLVQRQNNAFGTYARWQVLINQHELMGNTAGV